MSKYYEAFNSKLETYLSVKSPYTEPLDKIEKAVGIKKLYLAQGILGVFGLYMIIGHFAQLICNFVGFLYPAYCSIHALESTHVEDDKKWLTYWVVYAFFATAEFFSDIFFSWFPLYWLAKIIFLVWCFLPIEANGSMVIYHRFIRPVFLRNSSAIDQTVNDATNSFFSGASRLAKSD